MFMLLFPETSTKESEYSEYCIEYTGYYSEYEVKKEAEEKQHQKQQKSEYHHKNHSIKLRQIMMRLRFRDINL